jgi:hypothetical protein
VIATEADIPLIIELAQEAHQGSVWETVGTKPDPESIANSVKALIERDDAAVFVSERGVLMLARFPLWFDHGERVTNEIFFYATKGGDALRREGERWAGTGLNTLSRHETTDTRLESLYRRAGYVPIEHTFIRRA